MASTLSEIAEQLGVSTATVSRAINGKPGVSSRVRRAVLELVEESGYEPPAREARNPAGKLIGIIVPELENPIFAALGQTISTLLVQSGHAPMLCSQSAPGISEDEWIAVLNDQGMSGLIVVSGMHADTHASIDRYLQLRAQGVPLVLMNGHVPQLAATSISVDDAAAVESAVDHLIALGHRRLGLAVGPERYVPVIQKTAGFHQAYKTRPWLAGETPRVESSLFTIEGGYATANKLLDAGCTAIICASDVMALGAVRAARDRGLHVPGDVSVIGFDDSAFSMHTDPPLTTLRQPVHAMASAAVRTLLEEIRDGRHPKQEFLFRCELVLRASTSSASVRTPTPV